jgi:hypothetical protein
MNIYEESTLNFWIWVSWGRTHEVWYTTSITSGSQPQTITSGLRIRFSTSGSLYLVSYYGITSGFNTLIVDFYYYFCLNFISFCACFVFLFILILFIFCVKNYDCFMFFSLSFFLIKYLILLMFCFIMYWPTDNFDIRVFSVALQLRVVHIQ